MSDVKTFTWSNNGFVIEYSDPYITPFEGDIAESFKDVMYFYYTVKVYKRDELLIQTMVHDYPKVDSLFDGIHEMLGRGLDMRYVYEDFVDEDFDYSRKSYYDRIEFCDSFPKSREYSIKIERDYWIMKSDELKEGEDFTLTIGKNLRDRDDSGSVTRISDIEQSYSVDYLTRDDVLRLADVAKAFCEYALVKHREDVLEELSESGGDMG